MLKQELLLSVNIVKHLLRFLCTALQNEAGSAQTDSPSTSQDASSLTQNGPDCSGTTFGFRVCRRPRSTSTSFANQPSEGHLSQYKIAISIANAATTNTMAVAR